MQGKYLNRQTLIHTKFGKISQGRNNLPTNETPANGPANTPAQQ